MCGGRKDCALPLLLQLPPFQPLPSARRLFQSQKLLVNKPSLVSQLQPKLLRLPLLPQ